jgi:hypothetical protein
MKAILHQTLSIMDPCATREWTLTEAAGPLGDLSTLISWCEKGVVPPDPEDGAFCKQIGVFG